MLRHALPCPAIVRHARSTAVLHTYGNDHRSAGTSPNLDCNPCPPPRAPHTHLLGHPLHHGRVCTQRAHAQVGHQVPAQRVQQRQQLAHACSSECSRRRRVGGSTAAAAPPPPPPPLHAFAGSGLSGVRPGGSSPCCGGGHCKVGGKLAPSLPPPPPPPLLLLSAEVERPSPSPRGAPALSFVTAAYARADASAAMAPAEVAFNGTSSFSGSAAPSPPPSPPPPLRASAAVARSIARITRRAMRVGDRSTAALHSPSRLRGRRQQRAAHVASAALLSAWSEQAAAVSSAHLSIACRACRVGEAQLSRPPLPCALGTPPLARRAAAAAATAAALRPSGELCRRASPAASAAAAAATCGSGSAAAALLPPLCETASAPAATSMPITYRSRANGSPPVSAAALAAAPAAAGAGGGGSSSAAQRSSSSHHSGYVRLTAGAAPVAAVATVKQLASQSAEGSAAAAAAAAPSLWAWRTLRGWRAAAASARSLTCRRRRRRGTAAVLPPIAAVPQVQGCQCVAVLAQQPQRAAVKKLRRRSGSVARRCGGSGAGGRGVQHVERGQQLPRQQQPQRRAAAAAAAAGSCAPRVRKIAHEGGEGVNLQLQQPVIEAAGGAVAAGVAAPRMAFEDRQHRIEADGRGEQARIAQQLRGGAARGGMIRQQCLSVAHHLAVRSAHLKVPAVAAAAAAAVCCATVQHGGHARVRPEAVALRCVERAEEVHEALRGDATPRAERCCCCAVAVMPARVGREERSASVNSSVTASVPARCTPVPRARLQHAEQALQAAPRWRRQRRGVRKVVVQQPLVVGRRASAAAAAAADGVCARLHDAQQEAHDEGFTNAQRQRQRRPSQGHNDRNSAAAPSLRSYAAPVTAACAAAQAITQGADDDAPSHRGVPHGHAVAERVAAARRHEERLQRQLRAAAAAAAGRRGTRVRRKHHRHLLLQLCFLFAAVAAIDAPAAAVCAAVSIVYAIPRAAAAAAAAAAVREVLREQRRWRERGCQQWRRARARGAEAAEVVETPLLLLEQLLFERCLVIYCLVRRRCCCRCCGGGGGSCLRWLQTSGGVLAAALAIVKHRCGALKARCAGRHAAGGASVRQRRHAERCARRVLQSRWQHINNT
ncbi:hypothetical protein JKP88DRAFT_252132 [Tribonema minus]|uniref:Uncharacterized protein n=1 Tax=Tribonema minus TaxID=303371 RepID=A0A836CMC4_9STRA|nr:hypothetical protein JKP88DRAFT_252132 [Tribonema minus]